MNWHCLHLYEAKTARSDRSMEQGHAQTAFLTQSLQHKNSGMRTAQKLLQQLPDDVLYAEQI